MSESGASFGGKLKSKKFEGPGGTPGGVGEALVGLAMVGLGLYLVFDRVTVYTSFWHLFGNAGRTFGATLLVLLVGLGMLFFNGRSVLGWLLCVAGVLFIVVGVVMNLDVFFRPTTLRTTILMFGLIAGGIGLFAKGLRPHRSKTPAE